MKFNLQTIANNCTTLALVIHNRLVGCKDPESGIANRFVGISTTNTSDDIIEMANADSDTIVLHATNLLNDGVLYYSVAKVLKLKYSYHPGHIFTSRFYTE